MKNRDFALLMAILLLGALLLIISGNSEPEMW
jgi:hypothetical protein